MKKVLCWVRSCETPLFWWEDCQSFCEVVSRRVIVSSSLHHQQQNQEGRNTLQLIEQFIVRKSRKSSNNDYWFVHPTTFYLSELENLNPGLLDPDSNFQYNKRVKYICQDKSRQKSQLSIIQCLGQPIITDESPSETWFLLIWDFIESVKTMWSLKIFSVKAQILLVKTQDPLFASCFNWLCREPGWSFWGPLVRVEWGLDKHIYILPRAWIYLN